MRGEGGYGSQMGRDWQRVSWTEAPWSTHHDIVSLPLVDCGGCDGFYAFYLIKKLELKAVLFLEETRLFNFSANF